MCAEYVVIPVEFVCQSFTSNSSRWLCTLWRHMTLWRLWLPLSCPETKRQRRWSMAAGRTDILGEVGNLWHACLSVSVISVSQLMWHRRLFVTWATDSIQVPSISVVLWENYDVWCHHVSGVIKPLDVFSSERLCLSVVSTMIWAPQRVFTVEWECHKWIKICKEPPW
jgi:hypothetical protein